MATYDDYVLAVKNNVAQRVFKLEVLDENYNIISTLTPRIFDANLNLTSDSGSRRSCSVSFSNEDLNFLPSPTGNFWINFMCKLYSGYIVDGEPYYISRGIFRMGQPSVSSNLSDRTVELSLYDQYSFIDGTLAGTLENNYLIPVNSLVEQVIKNVIQDAGETRPVIIEPLNGETTSSTIILEAGSTYSEIIDKLCDMTSRNFFYNNEGYPVFQTAVNDLNNIFNGGSEWDFTTDEVIYMSGKRNYEFSKVRNVCKVIGSSISGITYDAMVEDNNPTSPTRINLIGRRSLVILDDVIYSEALCLQRAQYELQKSIQISESIDIECIAVDTIEGDSVITIMDEGLGIDEPNRYLVRSVNFNLLNSTMSLTCWRARAFQ